MPMTSFRNSAQKKQIPMMGEGSPSPLDAVDHGKSGAQACRWNFAIMLLMSATSVARADVWFPPVTQDSGFCAKIIQPLLLYNCTEYKVTTFDGFLDSIHLIQLIDYADINFLGDVLFFHPSVLGGSSWFLPSSPTPLAVADAGYSVWIGHTRATEFSFGHQQLVPSEKEFWDWDMDELANYDFPAFVDFISAALNGRKFHFVGYSQGARVGIGAISYQWSRAAALASVTLLAPVVYMTNTLSRNLLALNYTDVAEIGYHLGVGRTSFSSLTDVSKLNDIEYTDLEKKLFASSKTAYIALTGPYSATTYKNLAHIVQSMRVQTFMAYDYGSPNSNTEVYQSPVPPKYTLGDVPETVPLFVVYGGNDRLSTPTDVQCLISELSTQPEVLYLPLFAHLDFLCSSSLMTDVNLPLINFIGSNNHNLWRQGLH